MKAATQNKKKLLVIAGVILALAIVGGSVSGAGNGDDAAESATTVEAEAATGIKGDEPDAASTSESAEGHVPQVTTDSTLDDIKVDSCAVADDGVTFELSYDSADTNWITCVINRFEFGDKTVSMRYDSERDAYVADGITFMDDGEPSDFGSFQLQGGTKKSVKFVVDGFGSARDYDGFKLYVDEVFSGSWSGEFKDEYVTVHVS